MEYVEGAKMVLWILNMKVMAHDPLDQKCCFFLIKMRRG